MSDKEPLLEGQTITKGPDPQTAFYGAVAMVLCLLTGFLWVVL